jgi:hypothetical protein
MVQYVVVMRERVKVKPLVSSGRAVYNEDARLSTIVSGFRCRRLIEGMHSSRSRAIAAIGVLTLTVANCNPPRDRTPANGKYGEAALAHPAFKWDSIRTDRFTLYIPRGSFASTRAAQYRAEADSAVAYSLAMLGERSLRAHMQVFVTGSREDVEAITGFGSNGWGDAAGDNAAVVARPECVPTLFKHEIMHVVSLTLWGNPLGPDKDPYPPKDSTLMVRGGWLREGIASAAQDLSVTYSYRGLGAQYLAEGTLFSIDTLVNHFYQVDDFAAYVQSGSLVNYLLEKYGRDRFRVIWRDGAGAFERVYGRTAQQLQSEWHAWLRATPVSARPKSIAIARSEDICPRRRR